MAAAGSDLSALLEKADHLNNIQSFQECYDLLKEAMVQFPDNPEIMWRFARAHYDCAMENPSDKAQAKQYIEQGLNLATRSRELAPDLFATWKWCALLLSAMGDHIGSKEKIQNAPLIKEYALKALELHPKDPTTLHMLGRWCYAIASISWIERKIAAALFGAPPESSYDEALSYFQRADQLEARFSRNLFYLGECYLQLKRKDEARACFERLAALPAKSNVDRDMVAQAEQKLRKL